VTLVSQLVYRGIFWACHAGYFYQLAKQPACHGSC
jgi:hypothetical protein